MSDGTLLQSSFNYPLAIAYSTSAIYVSDSGNDVIRVIHLNGTVAKFAGLDNSTLSKIMDVNENKTRLQASFNNPDGIAFDLAGNLLVADRLNDRIRFINVSSGIVSLYTPESIGDPSIIVVDSQGVAYVADGNSSSIVSIDLEKRTQVITVFVTPDSNCPSSGCPSSLDPVSLAVTSSGVKLVEISKNLNTPLSSLTPSSLDQQG